MSKRQTIFLISLTAVAVILLSLFIVTTIDDVNGRIEGDCFNKLEDTSKFLASEIKRSFDSDRTILNAMAAIISSLDDPDDEELCEVLNTYRFYNSYISNTGLLRPDNTLLFADGTEGDASGIINFNDEAAAGQYISEHMQSVRYEGEMVIRNAVPVVKNGKTIYILYGVILLSDIAAEYNPEIYDGKAYVFIEDGDSGDFLLDTWHNTLGNIESFRNRRLEKGYSWDTCINELKEGKSGRLALTSKTTGEDLFLRYDPTGINNWNIMVMIPQSIAMHESETVSRRLYCMAAVIGTMMLFYMICVTWSLFKAYKKVKKLSNEDQTTGLQNRTAYERYFADITSGKFDTLTCVFIDVNGLHEVNNIHGHKVGDKILQIVADELLKEFPFRQVFRIGGDEFVVLTEEADEKECALRIERVAKKVESQGYFFSYGISYCENGIGADKIAQEADEKMLENKRAYYAGRERRRPRTYG